VRRTVRGLVVAVAGVSALLLVVARYAGRVSIRSAEIAPDEREGRPLGTPAPVGATLGAPDLSFYSTLGPPRAGAPAGGSAALPPGAVPPPVPAGAYVVQVLATRDAAAARRLRDRLASRGFPAVLSEGRAGTQPIYRVRAGRYRDRAGAEAAVKKLHAVPGVSPWILREAD
jgi:cell division septation protein DedD